MLIVYIQLLEIETITPLAHQKTTNWKNMFFNIFRDTHASYVGTNERLKRERFCTDISGNFIRKEVSVTFLLCNENNRNVS